jgi:hypothetical protein
MSGILQVLPLRKSKKKSLNITRKKGCPEGKERLSKNAKRCTKIQEEYAKCRKTMCECVKRQWQTETHKQGAKRKKTGRDCKTRQHQTEMEEQGAKL